MSSQRKRARPETSQAGQPVGSKLQRPLDSPKTVTCKDTFEQLPSPKPKRAPARKWTEDEERLFCEALELYGRDWKSCADHVGTRTASDFRSHAQKYFIRLFKQGRPVPAKVAESGSGHTLSGKPLDPNSAAARCYLSSVKSRGSPVTYPGSVQAFGGLDMVPLNSPTSTLLSDSDMPSLSLGSPHWNELSSDIGSACSFFDDVLADDLWFAMDARTMSPLTEMSSGTNLPSPSAPEAGDLIDLVLGDSPTENSVVSSVRTNTTAMSVMLLHCVLGKDQPSGLLAGTWDPVSRTVRVERAHALSGGSSLEQITVEEKNVRSIILRDGHSVVGWYTTQENKSTSEAFSRAHCLRTQLRDEIGTNRSNNVPFVGAIVSNGPARQAPVVDWFESSRLAAELRACVGVVSQPDGSDAAIVKELLHHSCKLIRELCKNGGSHLTTESSWCTSPLYCPTRSRVDALRVGLVDNLSHEPQTAELMSFAADGVITYLTRQCPLLT
eukprot:CAMPEP_0198312034 /NCGR_PEP_ID=MMETSP1450-20131203/3570_1 /TAXON_ID=753684 ORGANISM="Madagascaria erythrocladiodes, Strain CCMP3234" /NCGR_SAMPLE_ID=MMETSP1450 /ASSEMBLY_ACC=CAM_ASM_001115 /LENGTH=496 /DNA_ID=CAMNT_0044014959 /DNA_START=58 /DNA_END=1548 /DNA_ORIENTATION=+